MQKCITSLVCLFLAFLVFFSPPQISAAERSSYYDWGPYYNQTKVLGITFSSLEELPKIEVPENILPAPATGILPGNPFYFFDTLTENVRLTLTFDPVKKEEFRLSLASERLSEAKTLVEQENYRAAQAAATEYRNIMDTVSDNLHSLATQDNPRAVTLAENVEKLSADHAVVAQSAALSSPSAANATWNQFLTASEKAMDSAAETRGQPAIPEELSTSLQELKKDGLLTPEQTDKLYSLTSRGQVREEIDKLTSAGTFPPAEAAKLDTAVAVNYPDIYNQSLSLLKFAELRSYQTLPLPSEEVLRDIEEWRGQKGDLPPPVEIKPYLYHARASELAQSIDFTSFSADLQTEVAKFYPDAVSENPTYAPTPSPTPSPSPESSPNPAEPAPETTSPPEPTIPATQPYLAPYNGPLPGSPIYFFKQIGEGAGLFTAVFNPTRRIELSMQYAEERLKEANALALATGHEKDYQKTLEGYKNSLENITQNLKDYQGNEATRRDLAERFEAEAARHNVIFEKGLLPPVAENAEIMSAVVAATQNAMDASADALDKPALPLALEARLQDLKAQGQLLPEEVDKIVQSQSREEVREKIRELVKSETFPSADAKKLDEAQAVVTPRDYNQLVEVKKIEELQRLRATQAEFAQTATLRQTNANYETRIEFLTKSIDPSLIKTEDLAGREGLLATYQDLLAGAGERPINAGQFIEAEKTTSQANNAAVRPVDAILSTCPVGAIFKQFEGCVWETNGHKISDYEQYKCSSAKEYWSFSQNKCVLYTPNIDPGNDTQPLCPIGYAWTWESQSCQVSTSSVSTPSPGVLPGGDLPESEKENFCPAGASYQIGQGCVWDNSGKSVYDSAQYRCNPGSYYSFSEFGCVDNPDPSQPYPKNTQPACPEAYNWSWNEGRCLEIRTYTPLSDAAAQLQVPQPSFAGPDSPFYGLKRAFEGIQSLTAFSSQARQEVKLDHARERFAEAYQELEANDEAGFEESLSLYTETMQQVYNDLASTNFNEKTRKELGKTIETQVLEQNLFLQKAGVLASADLATSISAAVSVTIQGVDRAADLQGQPAIPEEIKTKIEALPADMISDENKQKLLATDNRVKARLEVNSLVNQGFLSSEDTALLDENLTASDLVGAAKLDELKKLDEIVELTKLTEEIGKTVEKNEDIAEKLEEFRQTFTPGQEIPGEIRPYVRLTRIDEVTQTIRPDIVRIEDFGNRRDLQLAVATLREEFRPTRETVERLEQYRRNNPGRPLPFDLARAESFSLGLGVRNEAGACYLPSPPFAPNTPCPAPGAAIPIVSYDTGFSPSAFGARTNTTDAQGKPFIYGDGPKPAEAGVCPEGYHWMYDSGGWCMSNSGSYGGQTTSYGNPSVTTPGYTPYTPYYSQPGVPPASYGYQGSGTYATNYYLTTGSPYTPPAYYGPAPTTYTTNPAPGTVPGSGPTPYSSGECPSGFHWMPPSYSQAGWCMSNGGTYTPGYQSGGGTSVTPGTQCPSGSYWNSYSGSCQTAGGQTYYPGGSGSTGSVNPNGCGPGYYWTGSTCAPSGSPAGTWSGSSTNSCTYPSAGCGSGWFDWGSCSCKTSSYSGSGTGGTTGSCSPPGGGCGSGYFDYGSCSCKAASSQGCYNVSASSCGSGFYWDSGACTCRSTSNTSTSYPTSSSTNTAPSSSGSTSSGSCPSGYHWMSDSGGWCMSDGTSGGGSTSTAPAPATTEPAPAPATTEPAPAPATTEPAPAPATTP